MPHTRFSELVLRRAKGVPEDVLILGRKRASEDLRAHVAGYVLALEDVLKDLERVDILSIRDHVLDSLRQARATQKALYPSE